MPKKVTFQLHFVHGWYSEKGRARFRESLYAYQDRARNRGFQVIFFSESPKLDDHEQIALGDSLQYAVYVWVEYEARNSSENDVAGIISDITGQTKKKKCCPSCCDTRCPNKVTDLEEENRCRPGCWFLVRPTEYKGEDGIFRPKGGKVRCHPRITRNTLPRSSRK